ncbi:MAG: hypothetical protein ACLQQ4_11145 [Bacteroidia bacterium]
MKKALLFLCTIVTALITHAQSDSAGLRRLPLVSYNNPNRAIHIKEGRFLTIHLVTDSASSHTYSGRIFLGENNSLLMIGGTEQSHGYSDAGYTYEERITSYTSDEITVIPYEEIESVTLIPRLRPVFSTLTVASLVVVCLDTPLAIGGSSFTAAPQIAEVAAATLVVDVILFKLFQGRRFKIKGNTGSRTPTF